MYAILLVFGPVLTQAYAALARWLKKKVPNHSFDLPYLLEICLSQLSTHWLAPKGNRSRKTIPGNGFSHFGAFRL